MISSLIRSALFAALLHVGASLAFDDDSSTLASAPPAQSCLAPIALSAEAASTQANDADSTGAQS